MRRFVFRFNFLFDDWKAWSVVRSARFGVVSVAWGPVEVEVWY